MSEPTVQRRSALTVVYREGAHGAESHGPGITLCERRDLRMINLRGRPADAEFLQSVRSALGVGLPVAPQTVAAGEHCTTLWLGPDEWLIVGGATSEISEQLPLEGASLTDVSHARTVVRVSGAKTRELLAKGVSLDLHPRAFKPGQCAQTAIVKMNVIVHQVGDAVFDVYVARSFAEAFWHWLTESAAEFGYRVAPPQR